MNLRSRLTKLEKAAPTLPPSEIDVDAELARIDTIPNEQERYREMLRLYQMLLQKPTPPWTEAAKAEARRLRTLPDEEIHRLAKEAGLLGFDEDYPACRLEE